MKKIILLCIVIVIHSHNCFAGDGFYSGLFWGSIVGGLLTVTSPSADDIAAAQERERKFAELKKEWEKYKEDKKNFCSNGFFNNIKEEIKNGTIPLLQVKHSGGQNIRYYFKNPSDQQKKLEVKVEDPILTAERNLYGKYVRVRKDDGSFVVGGRVFKLIPDKAAKHIPQGILPRVYVYYEDDDKKAKVERLKKDQLKTSDPIKDALENRQLRVITVSDSKGKPSFTYWVLDGKIIGVYNNVTKSSVDVNPKTESGLRSYNESIHDFNLLYSSLGKLSFAVDECSKLFDDDIPYNFGGRRMSKLSEKEQSDANIAVRRMFFQSLDRTVRDSQNIVARLKSDENGIVPNPCYDIPGVPFRRFYGFKIVNGDVYKYLNKNSDGKPHTNGSSYKTVDQFIQEAGITCESRDQDGYNQ